jgi:2-phospho-L-lactate guanylyltransferase
MGASNDMKTVAVLPVKRLDSALGRLANAVDPDARETIAEALFLDTITKLRQSRWIDEVLVVTADPSVSRQSRWLGHKVLDQSEDAGHSEAASAGARWARQEGADRVVMIPVDCPMLDIDELDDRLGMTLRAAIIVPDGEGSGTNALILSPPDLFAPVFGPDSCARHVSRARAAGVSFALDRIPSMATDLDTPEDMAKLRDSLLLVPDAAPRTAKLLWELGREAERTTAA